MTAPGLEPVGEAFARNFEDGHELGAAFAVWQGETLIIDLWGGYADREKTREWARDTIVPVFSTTKPIAALTLARLLEASGAPLGADTPVVDIWPDFGVNGKSAYTLGELVSHQAGLPGFPEPIDPDLWLDPPALAAAIAAIAPLWPRGEGSGYHPLTWGYLVGELFARLHPEGKSLGTVLAEEITAHLGPDGGDFRIGTGPEDDARIAQMQRPKDYPRLGELTDIKKTAFLTRWAAPNRGGETWRRVEIPSANGHGTARAVARLYGLWGEGRTLGGAPVFASPDVRAEMVRSRVAGPDKVLPFNVDFAFGVMRNSEGFYGPNPASLGHSGWGGSMAFHDPDRDLSVAYIMNRQSNHLQGDPRARSLIAALYGAL